MREENKMNGSSHPNDLKLNGDAKSVGGSQPNSKGSRNTGPKSGGQFKTDNLASSGPFRESRLFYEDPAEKLVLNDSQWNDIVQENRKKFEEEKKVAKQKLLEKNLRVQNEQLKQIEDRKAAKQVVKK